MGSEWATPRLADVCSKIGSGATPKGGSSVYQDDGEFALIRSQNVRNDAFDHNGLAFIENHHAEKLANVAVEERDVLLNITGDSVARCCQVDPDILPARVNQHVAIVRPDPKTLDPLYLRYYFVSPVMQNEMLSLAGVGATRNALTKGMIEDFEIPLPPLPEQKAIAHILGTLDDKIELNRRMNATLEGMAQALFKSWFVDFDPVIDNILARNLAKCPSPSLSHGERDAPANSSSSSAGINGDKGIQPDAIFEGIPDEYIPRACLRASHKQAEIRKNLSADALAREEALTNGTTQQGSVNHPTLPDPKTLFPAAFEFNDELGWIPEGWEAKKIENCISRFSAGKKYSQKTAEDGGCVPILDQGKSGIIGYHNDEPGVKASTDDPIIVFANHTCYMRLIQFDFSAIQNVLPYKGNGLNIYWIYEATKGRQDFIEYKGHWPDFVLNRIVVPSIDLVDVFGDVVEASYRKIYANTLENEGLTKIRNTLLPKLISGDLQIGDSDTLTEEVMV